VKKLILLLVAALGGYAAYKKSQQSKTGQDSWAEAVDRVPDGDPGR
jgi:hypothetical protein